MKKKIKFNTDDVRQRKFKNEIELFYPTTPAYRIGDVFEYFDLDNKTTFCHKIQKIEFVDGPSGYNQKLYLKLIDSTKIQQQLKLF